MFKENLLKNNPTYKYVLKIYKGFKYFVLQLFSHLHINKLYCLFIFEKNALLMQLSNEEKRKILIYLVHFSALILFLIEIRNLFYQ